MKTFTQTTLVLALFAGLAACDPGNTDHITTLSGRGGAGGGAGAAGHTRDEGTVGTGGGAGLVDVDAGTSDAIPIDPNAAFFGTWRYFVGNLALSCEDGTTPVGTPDGAVTFVAGNESDQVIAVDDSGCQIPCKVSGNTAVAVASVNCADEQVFFTSLAYTLTNGTLHEQGAGRMVYQGLACGFTDDSQLTQR
ncbi:MAG TPA: hypothetical protein VH560_18675 [Polyangia bacterium]|jgi:hypothetical protein|nr:hypothetical protein [Polyangia bacterium]